MDMTHDDDLAPRSRRLNRLAAGLGWFSIGLGLVELLAPRAMARATGLAGKESLLQLYGLREVATGVAILAADDPRPGIYARVVGDALDGVTLASGLTDDNPHRASTIASILAVSPVVALDAMCARALSQTTQQPTRQYDYSDRSGLPLPPAEMRGAAREDFQMPPDMRTPAPLRPQQLH